MMGPDDIELGDEVIEVERKPRAGVVLSVRLSAEEADQLQAIAEKRRTTLSRVAREALAGYIARGPERPPAMGSWTGTVGIGGHFELTYAHHGRSAETVGSVKSSPASKSAAATIQGAPA
jgi:predicted transcriptional regulator